MTTGMPLRVYTDARLYGLPQVRTFITTSLRCTHHAHLSPEKARGTSFEYACGLTHKSISETFLAEHAVGVSWLGNARGMTWPKCEAALKAVRAVTGPDCCHGLPINDGQPVLDSICPKKQPWVALSPLDRPNAAICDACGTASAAITLKPKMEACFALWLADWRTGGWCGEDGQEGATDASAGRQVSSSLGGSGEQSTKSVTTICGANAEMNATAAGVGKGMVGGSAADAEVARARLLETSDAVGHKLQREEATGMQRGFSVRAAGWQRSPSPHTPPHTEPLCTTPPTIETSVDLPATITAVLTDCRTGRMATTLLLIEARLVAVAKLSRAYGDLAWQKYALRDQPYGFNCICGTHWVCDECHAANTNVVCHPKAKPNYRAYFDAATETYDLDNPWVGCHAPGVKIEKGEGNVADLLLRDHEALHT